jgi:hypothetical protein
MKTKQTRIFRFVLAAALLVACAFHAGEGARADGTITAENWGEMVGFKPDLTTVPIKPGEVIGKWNVKKVEPLLTPGLLLMIKKYELRLKLREYKPVHPSQGYIEATNKYRGKTKIVDIGKEYRKSALKGYVAGLPFPQPKNGLEVAYDYDNNYNGDDGKLLYDTIWISASSGVEHSETWEWSFIMRTVNRTDIQPIPAIGEYKDKGVKYVSSTKCVAPYDKKGFSAVYTRSIEPLDMQGHIYVPAMRRIIRNTFGTRGDTWNATDYLYEDIRGYMGYPEWMNWKLIGEKTILLPMHDGTKRGKDPKGKYEIDKWPHWNPKAQWEPRPTYVVDVRPRIPDYPYSRQTFYVDAETFAILYKESYDKKGDLWKVVLGGWNEPPDMNTAPMDPGIAIVVDFQAEHATLTNIQKTWVNSNYDPNLFTISNLRKTAR